MRTLGGNVPIGSNARSARLRRVPFVRDVVFDHGRASAPRMTGSHMLPSTLLTVSASAELWFSRLNSTPATITVYASQPPSPATTQHSLPGARYSLPGPDFHRQDHASSCLAHKQSMATQVSWNLRSARHDGAGPSLRLEIPGLRRRQRGEFAAVGF